jgi:hypothetical protein
MSLIIPSIDSTNISNINNARVSYSSFARESNRDWVSIASDSTGRRLAAATNADRIYTSTDSGLTWTPRENIRAWYDIASNSDGTVLVAILFSGTQVYISTDSGLNWTPRTVTVSNKNWRSVAINSTGTIMATVATSDANVYVSTDTGSSWVARGTGAPGTPEFESIAMNSSGTIMITSNFGGRLYVSTDSGTTWNNRDSDRGWLSVASNSSGDNLFAVVSGGLDGFVYRSTDFGVTWVAQMTDAPRNWYYIATNSTGRRLIAFIGFRGGPSQLYISTDSGVSWVVRESTRNWVEGASNSDGTKFFAVASSDKIYMIAASNPFITIGNSFMNTLGENTDNLSVAYIPSAAISATNAMTATNYSSLYIEGAPVLSTNVTGTNPYALNISSGASLFGGPIKGNATFNGFSGSVLICPNTESATATTTLQIVPSSTTAWTGGIAQIIMGDANHLIRNQFLGDSSGQMEFIDINGFQFRRTTGVTAHTTVSDTGNWTVTNTTQSTSATTGALVVEGGIGMGNTGTGNPPTINWGTLYTTPANRTAKMISLFNGFDITNRGETDQRFYGFGISANQLCYHISNTNDAHIFYRGTGDGDNQRTELFRINGNGTIGRIQMNSFASPTVIYYTPPLTATQINPHYAIYNKSYGPITTWPCNLFTFTGGTTLPLKTDSLCQMFSIHIAGGQQNIGGWASSFNFSITGATPNLGNIVQTYNHGSGGLVLSSTSSSNVLTLRVTPASTAPANSANFSVTLTVYPAYGIDSTAMYVITQS